MEKMDKRLKRFLETTLPMIIGYGLVLIISTAVLGIGWGLLGILIFSVIDVLMIEEVE